MVGPDEKRGSAGRSSGFVVRVINLSPILTDERPPLGAGGPLTVVRCFGSESNGALQMNRIRLSELRETPNMTDATVPATSERTFFGQPRGLAYLAFTEAWERFSFYGMSSLLVLYMTQQLLMPGHVRRARATQPLTAAATTRAFF